MAEEDKKGNIGQWNGRKLPPNFEVTQEWLLETFLYHPKGVLVVKNPDWNTRRLLPWNVNRGRVIGRIGKKTYLMHRLIWLFHHGEWPSIIDHINGNTLDNRIENLRIATRLQNSWNRGPNKNNKSGFKGVRLRTDKKLPRPWQALIGYKKRLICVGHFATAEEAAEAYNRKAEELYGEFARKPPGPR